MAYILITQRVDKVEGREEVRDCLDQRWWKYIERLGFKPFPVPNKPESILEIAKGLDVAGLILSGGNDIGEAPERDKTEKHLIDGMRIKSLPILGVCRGHQVLSKYLGKGTLKKIEGHAGTSHTVSGEINKKVNSYHDWVVTDLKNPNFKILAKAQDGTIEAISHKEEPIMSVMWHPERLDPFDAEDLTLFRLFFETRSCPL